MLRTLALARQQMEAGQPPRGEGASLVGHAGFPAKELSQAARPTSQAHQVRVHGGLLPEGGGGATQAPLPPHPHV